MRFVAASYNVHGCVGRDRVHSPERIARVIAELDADIVALQEVTSADVLRNMLAQELVFVETMPGFGNAIVSRLPMRHRGVIDLSVAGREPRGALHVEVDFSDVTLHVIAAHLGLMRGERLHQASLIAHYTRALSPLLVLGDFNEWRPLGSRTLDAVFGTSVPLRTFPARFPLLALDRIWLRAQASTRFNVHASALARVASDHLPIRVSVDT